MSTGGGRRLREEIYTIGHMGVDWCGAPLVLRARFGSVGLAASA